MPARPPAPDWTRFALAVALAGAVVLAGCKAPARRGRAADPSGTGAEGVPVAPPETTASNAVAGARDGADGEGADAADDAAARVPTAEVEPGPYEGDARFTSLAAGWRDRVDAAAERLATVLGVDVRERSAPRVVLAALRDDRLQYAISSEVADGRRRPVVRVNAERLVAGTDDPDRALLRALATATAMPPLRPTPAPAWFRSFVALVAAGDLAERLEALAQAAAAGGAPVRVDPIDESLADASGAAALVLASQHADAAGVRRVVLLAAEGQDPGLLLARLAKDPDGQWAGVARRALEETLAEVDVSPARALAKARAARKELGREGLEEALRGVGGVGATRTRFEAEADATRLAAAIDLGDGFAAREVLERTPPTPTVLGRLADPGSYLLAAARAEMLPGGDAVEARARLRRFETDYPSHPERETALDDLARLSSDAPVAERGAILARLLDVRGADRLDPRTTSEWVDRLLADHRSGAARRFLAAHGARATTPELEVVAARVAEAEDAPSAASFEANRRRVDAWLAEPTAATAADVADGGVVAAGGLALHPRFPSPRDERRPAAVRLLVRAAGFPGAVELLVVRWGPTWDGLAEDLDVLAGEADWPTFAHAVAKAIPGLDDDVRASSAVASATFGLEPSWLAAHPTALERLRSADFSTRRAAFEEVVAADVLRKAPTLLVRTAKDSAAVLRRLAVIEAGRLGEGAIARAALSDEAGVVRRAACLAVVDAKELAAVPDLVARTTAAEPDPGVRLVAAQALVALAPNDRRTVAALVAIVAGREATLADDAGRRLAGLPGVADALAAALRREVSKPEADVDRSALFRLFLAYRRSTKRDPGYDPSLPIERVREIAAALPEGSLARDDGRR